MTALMRLAPAIRAFADGGTDLLGHVDVHSDTRHRVGSFAVFRASGRNPVGSTGYTSAVKIAVSVPDALYARAEEFAARLGMKRSQLYARAVEEFLLAHDEDAVTAALDALAVEAASSVPEGTGRAAGKALIDSGDWEW
jgi:hypothetical protein